MAPKTALTLAVAGLLGCTSAQPQGPCGGACVSGQTCVDDRCVWPGGADAGVVACLEDVDCDGGRCVDGECFAAVCDDGAERACESACGGGVQRCRGWVWRPCTAPTPQPTELCGDAVDEDCDGQLDEGCEGCTDGQQRACETACGAGLQACAGGAWAACDAPRPEAEICETAGDEDCDGQVDEGCAACEEGATRPCATACGAGEEACTGGEFGACDAPSPDAEGRCPGAPGCDDAARLPRGASRLTGVDVDARFPKPVWTGSGWAVFWGQSEGIDGDVWLALRDADGRPAGAPRVVLDRHFADAVWLGDAFFVAGVEVGQVAFARPGADGSRGLVTEPFRLPTDSFSEGQLAAGPAGIGVAWSDGLESVWFMRLDRDARELAAPVQVAEAAGRQHEPSLVADPNGFTVAWKDDRADPDGYSAPAVYVRQLTVDGQPRGPERRVAGGTSPSLARLAGGGYLLAFVDHRDGRNDDVYVAPLTSAGERAGPDVLISDSPANARAPSVAPLGAGAWHDRRQDPADAIRVARLSADGAVLGGVEAVTDGAAPAIHPALAVAEADRLAVSWMDRRHTDEAFGPAAAYTVVGPLLCPEE